MEHSQPKDINKSHKKPMYGIKKRKDICSWGEAWFFIIGSIFYIGLLSYVAFLVTKIPDYDTKSPIYKKIFSRDNHYTTVFSFGKFVLWMTLVISGFAFVNQVNLMNQRRSLFRGRDGTYRDFIILVLLSVILYFFAPIIALRSRHDMQRDLQFSGLFKNELPIENHYPGCKGHTACAEPFPILPPLPEYLRFLIREFSLFFYQLDFPIAPNWCYLYTDYEIVFHNSCFIIAFWLGMNYTHLDFPPFSQFGFTVERIKNYTWLGWIMMITFTSGVLFNMYYIYYVHFWTNFHTYRKSLCRNSPHEMCKILVINVFELIFIAQFIN